MPGCWFRIFAAQKRPSRKSCLRRSSMIMFSTWSPVGPYVTNGSFAAARRTLMKMMAAPSEAASAWMRIISCQPTNVMSSSSSLYFCCSHPSSPLSSPLRAKTTSTRGSKTANAVVSVIAFPSGSTARPSGAMASSRYPVKGMSRSCPFPARFTGQGPPGLVPPEGSSHQSTTPATLTSRLSTCSSQKWFCR